VLLVIISQQNLANLFMCFEDISK